MAPLYPHDLLIRWAVQHGGFFHDDVEVVLTPEKGYHLVVRRDVRLESGTQVATCPISCSLSILNVIDAEGGFTCRGIKIPFSFVSKQPRENTERFFLMEHYLVGKKSWWAPYIATLPTPEEVRHMQFEKPDDLVWVQGTNLGRAFEKQSEQWRVYYEQGMEHLLKLNWQNAKSGRLTWDLYRWAATIFTSRSFTSDVLTSTLVYDKASPIGRYTGCISTVSHRHRSGKEQNEHAELTALFADKFPVLLPVLDILNYRPLAKVEWQAACFSVGLQVLEVVESGAEVSNNYGPRDNETLLLGYGFTIPNNPFDHFSVAIRLPEGVSLKELRAVNPPPASSGPPYNSGDMKPRAPELRCYVFKPEHPDAVKAISAETALFSLDLLDAISVLRATDREWQAMYNFRKTYFAEGLEKGRFEDSRNLLATMSQLLIECTARLEVLHEAAAACATPMNLKQIFARTYRDSQIDILQIAIFMCRFILRRAIQNEYDQQFQGNDHQLMQSMAARHCLSSSHILRLDKLRSQHKCMSTQNELLGFEQVLSLMPCSSRVLLPHLNLELDKERRLNEGTQIDIGPYQLAKIHLSLSLSAMLAERSRQTLEQPRLKAWFDQLTQWYPPDDPNWTYVPNRSPATPAEAAPPLLLDLLDSAAELVKKGSMPDEAVSLLQPSSIAWGWNVMEEEGVGVPMEVLDDRPLARDANDMAFFLYLPQLPDHSTP